MLCNETRMSLEILMGQRGISDITGIFEVLECKVLEWSWNELRRILYEIGIDVGRLWSDLS